ncbi:MAG: hypothetical protein EOP61_00295 [Sphingomonadales bacterium]|nr:MAG: hypothetical protein EOP61_00295 [Sphingomonadales bacterium]
MEPVCHSTIDSLVHIWSALHKDAPVALAPPEAHYLRRLILHVEDELLARLLAAKLAASRTTTVHPGRDVARLGSEILYSVRGQQHRARLVHGESSGDGALGVGSRFGSALIGFRVGQAVLWPLEQDRLVELKILRVEPPRPVPRGAALAAMEGRPIGEPG